MHKEDTIIFKNKYKIDNDKTILYLNRRDGSMVESYIDTEDVQKLIDYGKTWCVAWNYSNKMFYVRTNIYLGKINGNYKYSTMGLHTFLLNPEKVSGVNVDHIDHNPLNNCKYNLRILTTEQNLLYRKGVNVNNNSGYRNVSWTNGKWVVQLQINGVNKVLGKFDDVHEAGRFAKEKRNAIYGRFAGVG